MHQLPLLSACRRRTHLVTPHECMYNTVTTMTTCTSLP